MERALRAKISYPFEFKVLVVVKQPAHTNLIGHDHVGADNHKLSPNIERVPIGISPKGYFKIEISKKDLGFGRFRPGPVCS